MTSQRQNFFSPIVSTYFSYDAGSGRTLFTRFRRQTSKKSLKGFNSVHFVLTPLSFFFFQPFFFFFFFFFLAPNQLPYCDKIVLLKLDSLRNPELSSPLILRPCIALYILLSSSKSGAPAADDYWYSIGFGIRSLWP